MKPLVIFYSLEGNTKFIADAIAKAAKADILEIKPKKEINTKGFMRFLWGGGQVVMREKPHLLPFDKNPQDYDVIFIGTPVWAFSYSAPLNTFFHNAGLKGKKFALFVCHGGVKKNTLGDMKKALPGNEFIGEIDFFEPLKNDRELCAKKAERWAKKIINDA